MRVAKWGHSLAVRLPAAVIEALSLKEGDEIEIRVATDRTVLVERTRGRQQAMERLRRLRRSFPLGFRFNRDEANRR
ncbi:AbrB/MazE/SpoVT family DNA-binding domain-containing protein [Inquilinus sp. YAF38]|uniref:AbrB/MazE/SpoVT family DNA-binding domain-containing protein n=1 Tax=Inquilinus sp. YAF38 TaxID=3233084 RepID=UPI003F8DECCC